ncbi:unnamed protein product [Calicophoron daubneyi]|uniref:Uncharacterized protein n=1 Tax=Calicophoron daubneyi TaxID=300641 RepID=A0AAV2TX78_CALDB
MLKYPAYWIAFITMFGLKIVEQQIIGDKVELIQMYTAENRLSLRCVVKGRNAVENLVFLGCPSVPTGMCRENCKNPHTAMNEHIPITTCEYKVISPHHVEVRYDLQLIQSDKPGRWWCMFRGLNSESVILKYEHPSIPKPKSITETGAPNESTKERSVSNSTHQNLQTTQALVAAEESLKLEMSFEMFIMIVSFATLSIVFNILFFIRCCAINRYLRKLHEGYPRIRWADLLLCVDKPRKPPPKPRADYIRIPNSYVSANPYDVRSGTMKTCSPVLIHGPRTTSPIPFYPTAASAPYYLRSLKPISPELSLKGSSDMVYDEVHNSVYTTLDPVGESPEGSQFPPVRLTPDGRSWVYARARQTGDPNGQPRLLNTPALQYDAVRAAAYLQQATACPNLVTSNKPKLAELHSLESSTSVDDKISKKDVKYSSKRLVTPLPLTPSQVNPTRSRQPKSFGLDTLDDVKRIESELASDIPEDISSASKTKSGQKLDACRSSKARQETNKPSANSQGAEGDRRISYFDNVSLLNNAERGNEKKQLSRGSSSREASEHWLSSKTRNLLKHDAKDYLEDWALSEHDTENKSQGNK